MDEAQERRPLRADLLEAVEQAEAILNGVKEVKRSLYLPPNDGPHAGSGAPSGSAAPVGSVASGLGLLQVLLSQIRGGVEEILKGL